MEPEELNEFYDWTNSSKESVFNEFYATDEASKSYFESQVLIDSKPYDVIFNVCQDVSESLNSLSGIESCKKAIEMQPYAVLVA